MKINRNSGAEQPNPLPQQPTPVRRAPKAAPIRQETYDDPDPDEEEDEEDEELLRRTSLLVQTLRGG